MEAEILHKHLNRKGGFPMYATDPVPQKGIEEVEKEGWRARGTLIPSPKFFMDASLGSLDSNRFGVPRGMSFLFH